MPPAKKATSAMITDFSPTVKPTKTAPTIKSMASHESTIDAAGVAFSRASSIASTPTTQSPAVSAPPTPTPHTKRRAANSAPQQNDAHLAALHEAILRVDDFADLSVREGPLGIRRALPTTSVTAPATVLKDNESRFGAKVAGLFNQFVDLGKGTPKEPIKTPHGGKANKNKCFHCTHTTHCDCEYVAKVFKDVFENQLTQTRITERSSSSAAAAAFARSQSLPLTEGSAAGSSTSANISVLSSDDENSYGCAPAALSRLAVTGKTMGRRNRHLCAKSLLPPFVARIIRLLDLQPGDTFYDLGCGNGSILFQVALSAGATCVGVELCPHNAQLAREAWSHIGPMFESRVNSEPIGAKRPRCQNVGLPTVGLPHVEIITGDITNIITDPAFTSRPRKILLSNLLFHGELNLFISEEFRKLPMGSMIVCFEDLYPHARSVSRILDPRAFALFQMTDYIWPEYSVEWTKLEGKFYIHTRK